MKKIIFFSAFLFSYFASSSVKDELSLGQIKLSDIMKTEDLAIVIIDMQDSFSVRGGYSKIENNAKTLEEIIKKQKELIAYAKEENKSIIFVEYTGHGETTESLKEMVAEYDKAKFVKKNTDGLFSPYNRYKKEIQDYLSEKKLKTLLIAGANGGACIFSTLREALQENYVCHSFPAFIADFNYNHFIHPYEGSSTLRLATATNDLRLMKHLLKSKVDPNETNQIGYSSNLYGASRDGQHEAAKLLLEHKADIKKSAHNKEHPLYRAASEGHNPVVELLLRHGATIEESVCEDGLHPLFIAALEGHDQVVQTLLTHKVDPETARYENYHPLFQAAGRGKNKVIKTLLRHKVKIRETFYAGLSPLWMAAQSKYLETVKILLELETEEGLCAFTEKELRIAETTVDVNLPTEVQKNILALIQEKKSQLGCRKNLSQILTAH